MRSPTIGRVTAHPGAASSARAALEAAACYGPYFTTDPAPRGAGWHPVSSLWSPDVLGAEIASTATALGTGVPGRVAASTWHLGLTAQLTSPLLGAALRGGLPLVSVEDVWVRSSGGPRQVTMRPTGARPCDGAALADGVQDLLTPLCDAVGRRYAVSATVLWGNVAASLTGASRVVAVTAPDDAAAARRLVGAALRCGRLRGTVDDAGFRRSCCLFYRAPGGGYCGDCVLAAPRTTRGR